MESHARLGDLSPSSAANFLLWPRENAAILAGKEACKSCLSLVSWLAMHCDMHLSKKVLKANMSGLTEPYMLAESIHANVPAKTPTNVLSDPLNRDLRQYSCYTPYNAP